MATTDVEPSVYGPLYEQFEHGMPLVALPSLLGRLGLLQAVIGLMRAGTVPVWAALMLVPTVVLMGSMGMLPLPLGIALSSARSSSASRSAPAASPAPGAPP